MTKPLTYQTASGKISALKNYAFYILIRKLRWSFVFVLAFGFIISSANNPQIPASPSHPLHIPIHLISGLTTITCLFWEWIPPSCCLCCFTSLLKHWRCSEALFRRDKQKKKKKKKWGEGVIAESLEASPGWTGGQCHWEVMYCSL